MNQFDDLKEEMEAIIKKMEERGREAFKAGSAQLFNGNPDLVSFSWTQYTPYFNDGDPCEFGVNSYLDIEFSDGTFLEEWTDYSSKYEEEANEGQRVTADAAYELVSAIPENVMKTLFGDHVKVTVFRDRVEVDEYEHE
jgi:hypothetical protein